MADRARAARVPFKTFEVLGANHFDILFPLTRLVAKKIVEDTGPACAIRFTDAKVQFKRRSH